jgi:hypothetical protein
MESQNNQPTNDQMFAAVASARYKSLGADLEVTLWENGTVDVAHWMNKFIAVSQVDPDAPESMYVKLLPAQARRLRRFLNKPIVKQFLGITSPDVQNVTPAQAVNLGSHSVKTYHNQSIVLQGEHEHIALDHEEAYRLYTVLHALFQQQP